MGGGGVFVLAVLFLTIVAPLWIIFHYVTKWRSARGLSAEDERTLAELWDSAGRMENRIVSLEKILDAEAPGWRNRQ
ncbi:envelope stress response membrane protein PspB [Skermanella mucosa]|uniref:envelope stress response membrane protein PspB n=1 Tax=Skermanella TaxID=204447 RepID=UPI0013017ACF|nr:MULTISPECIES: envelope stress response membrane protein PspB [Skermanella]UEM21508.1 envelope stress response membrane protein PspB [Skermanella mucosa]